MATQIKIKTIPTGYQSIITNGKHTIIGDEPIKSKGTDLGLAPTELVLAGLSMCKTATVRFIARKKGWEIGDVDAELSQVVKRDKEGKLTPHITTKIKIEGDITEEQKAELISEANNCYVHRLLQSEWEIAHAEEWIEDTVEA